MFLCLFMITVFYVTELTCVIFVQVETHRAELRRAVQVTTAHTLTNLGIITTTSCCSSTRGVLHSLPEQVY